MKIIQIVILCASIFLPSQLLGSMTETQAHQAFKRVKSVLKADLQRKNLDVGLRFKSGGKPGAFAKWEKQGSLGKITMRRAFLDLPLLNSASLQVVLCHEFGHFLGGAPYVQPQQNQSIFTFNNPYEGLSVEGQADLFATSSCVKKVIKKTSVEIDPFVSSKCENLKIENCEARVSAIYQTIKLYRFILVHEFDEPYEELDLTNLSSAPRTLHFPGEYPNLSCRLQTLLNGLQDRKRPRCWYNPET